MNSDIADDLFASTHKLYRIRAKLVPAAPVRWLDVGCGHAHFALEAKRHWPLTEFEGLDRSSSVDEAYLRGWISRAWRADMSSLAAAGERFDAVSLFHYLEHTQDPAAELSAASQLLLPEGRLLIEVPNPRCRLSRWLGRWWFPWFQPQHQCFLNEDCLLRMLASAGMTPISVTYYTTANDILLAALLATRRLCSPGDVPWMPRAGLARRALDVVTWGIGTPVLILAAFAGAVYGALPPSPRHSNAFQVVAVRKES